MRTVQSRATGWGRWSALAVRRPQVSVEMLALAASLFFAAFSNGVFWRAVADTGALQGLHGLGLATSLLVASTALNMLLLCVLLNRWSAKGVLVALLLVTAVAVYFMQHYMVYFDADMVRNILHTDAKESRELVSWHVLPPLLLQGVLPAVVVWRLRLRERSIRQGVLMHALWGAAAALVATAALLASFQDISALVRNHRELRYLVTPGNYLVSLATVALSDGARVRQPTEPVGIDAVAVARAPGSRPRLLVLVVGETVRAANWGLNGYARQTTPQLAALQPVNFSQVAACGSATEVSVPCMFSAVGRRAYDEQHIKHSESLLHVLEHAGIHTAWRDNQTGCKGVCTGLAFESFEHARDPGACTELGCLDQVMLADLTAAARPGADSVIVLHQLGNHGPAYFRRYPASLRRFTPTCDTDELGDCSQRQIVNAYDNAVLQTDDFLARTIALLAADRTRDTALVYVSDHGESLGEHGLYLHGIPYAIAPQTQTRVPMVMWFSPGMVASRGLDLACLRRRAALPASHDNLFHSILGLMQVDTRVREPQLDLFAGCTAAAVAARKQG